MRQTEKRKYVSPLLEELLLGKEDVLTASGDAAPTGNEDPYGFDHFTTGL